MAERVPIKFDKYHLYAELTDYLHQYALLYPDFLTLESIGKSHEGREVWAATITNKATGSEGEKPALYVDANIHAGEVTGGAAALYLIDYLLTNYSVKREIKELLDTRTFYILPRINPDGVELYLTTPKLLRSSVRPYPDFRQHEDPPGLCEEDFNHDGQILRMRLRDDRRGAWRADYEDARLMVERSPLDVSGPFYHLFSEGVVRDHLGNLVEKVELPFPLVPTKYGLDLNRNFPSGYSPLTAGSGPFPLSEPETRNQVEFVNKHKNIAGVILYHTWGGVLFRPHSTIPDKDFAGEDIALYEAVGKLGTDTTGYPVVCCYGDVFSGVFDDWCFEQLGLLAYTPELWDPIGRAAPDMKVDPLQRKSKADWRKMELKLLQWSDRELWGEGFVPWHEVDHPQFGKVELGGWRVKECRQNAPLHLLKSECHRMTLFSLAYARALPEVQIDEIKVEKLAENMFSVHAVVSNHSYLSTNITEQAKKQRAVRADIVRLDYPPQVELINSEHQYEIGHLQGYHAGQQVWYYHAAPPQKGMARVRWNLRTAGSRAEVTVTLVSQRGGTRRQTVTLY
ncbi:MAG: hypothetical protein KGZ50_05025 [Peptococcaceae bacterium]|nr:hypothetical protein [Peptococcaceae bacterium]